MRYNVHKRNSVYIVRFLCRDKNYNILCLFDRSVAQPTLVLLHKDIQVILYLTPYRSLGAAKD